MKNRTIGFIGAFALTSALALSSCSAESTGGSAETVDADRFDVVNIGIGTDGGKIYQPFLAPNHYAYHFLNMSYDSLLRLADDGELEPALSTGYEWSDDRLTLTFTLRDDVVFHDGETFNADAVKAYIDAAIAHETSTVKADLAAVESVNVIDDTTVEFRLSTPDGALPAALSGRAGMIISPAALNNDDLDRFPVGAGPYIVSEHTPGASVTYDRFDDYYDFDEARAEQVVMTIMLDAEARLRALQVGQVDVISLAPSQVSVAEAQGLPVQIFETGKMNFMIYMNMREGTPLADQRVRNAISYGIDRDALNESVFAGLCTPSANAFGRGTWYSSPNAALEHFEHDPEKAKNLLAEAGYAGGLELGTVSISTPPFGTFNEALGGQLAEIGITADTQIGDPSVTVTNFLQAKTTPILTTLLSGAADPAGLANSIMSPTAVLNPGDLDVPEISALMAEARAETDQAKRAVLYHQIDDLNAEQSFHVSVCELPQVHGVAERVQGLRVPANGLSDYSNLRVTE